MGALLSETFFTDKVRSIVTILALLAILALGVISWAFPRHPKLDNETIQSLKEVTSTLNRTATTLEQQSRIQADINEAMKKQLAEAEISRNKNYADMLKDYGLPDVDLPTGASSSTYPYGLPTPDHDQRRGSVPASPSPTGANQFLQVPTPVRPSPLNPGNTSSPK